MSTADGRGTGATPNPVGARGPSAARARLLRTASELFYADGVRAVGVDRVIAEAGVTRATFYRHFPGKEALVVAYLDATDRAVREAVGDVPQDAAAAARWLTGMTLRVADELCRPGFRGCPFINAAAEFPDPGSPVRRVVRAHRDWLQDAATRALRVGGHPDPQEGGRRWTALRDGAMVAGYLDDADAARATLRDAVEDLVRSR
ncbi:TetR/AcrR family transcriptional regulator [Cellulomonas xiejunii]|uniref:TetR/AcrR family transcriptional regulator n=1 Tax=Cellulomonas xiejunii TaxID=2968083 RepID=UPI001D0EE890|nr:TetR/AcrR family transcriptional regulator [Cellulomonas xiejunii]MCC2314279.1 TetR/AcrR family transcriptional regulator [Cellulomonas xiejunii]